MPHHYNLPLTYPPKLTPVKNKQCRQTIRLGNKKKVGDYVRFFTWSGKPYRSKRVWVMEEYQPLVMVRNIIILPSGIIMTVVNNDFPVNPLPKNVYARATLWTWDQLDWLATLDGISPTTGIELGKVLMGKNKIPEEGAVGQILRWG